MPKSYKICHCDFFDKSNFNDNVLNLNSQPHLNCYIESPTAITKITKNIAEKVHKEFEPYFIEHEHNVNVKGRYFDQRFDHFLRNGEINGYYSQEKQLFLLQGKKDDILDFCKFTETSKLLNITTIEIQMADLLEKLGSVNNCWFKFKKGSISASALFGTQLENTDEFIAAKEYGDISALTFFYNMNGISHAIMLTNDGTVVLQHNYPNIEIEIDIVLRVKKDLLDGIYNLKNSKKKKNEK